MRLGSRARSHSSFSSSFADVYVRVQTVDVIRIAEQLRGPLSVQRIFGRFGENIIWYKSYIALRGEKRIPRKCMGSSFNTACYYHGQDGVEFGLSSQEEICTAFVFYFP
jgi:hypothetical protein